MATVKVPEVDTVGEHMKKLNQGDDEITAMKDILAQAKKERSSDKAITIELFAKIGKLAMCQPSSKEAS